VMLFTVFSERLSVIGHHGDYRSVKQTLCAQRDDEPPNYRVGVCNFSIVRRCLVVRSVGFRGAVGIVRIIKMDPKEKGMALMLAQPSEGAI